MAFFWFFIVLAITYNQGAARPADSQFGFITKNGLDLSDDMGSDDINFQMPTIIRQGLVITIKGRLNTSDKTFTVQLLSSIGAKEDCQIKFDFQTKNIDITPAFDDDYAGTLYDLKTSSQGEPPLFTLRIIARENPHGHTFSMHFNGNKSGESNPLICKIEKFDDIKYIVMKEGVAHVDSLLFEFEENH